MLLVPLSSRLQSLSINDVDRKLEILLAPIFRLFRVLVVVSDFSAESAFAVDLVSIEVSMIFVAATFSFFGRQSICGPFPHLSDIFFKRV